MTRVPVDPELGGGGTTTVASPSMREVTHSVEEYRYDDARNNFTNPYEISYTGKVNVYNIDALDVSRAGGDGETCLIGFNPYGYITELVTNDLNNRNGEMYSGSGPHTFEFYSIFKMSDRDESGEEYYRLHAINRQAWQTIAYSRVEIYLEDESGNRIDLDPLGEGVGVTTLSNAAAIEKHQSPPVSQALVKILFKALLKKVAAVLEISIGTALNVITLLSAYASTKFVRDKFSTVSLYDRDHKTVLVEFSWGNPDQELIESQRHRQELIFKIFLNFYTPAITGNYDLVFNQTVYVDPSSLCKAPLNNPDYAWDYHRKTGSDRYWARMFETRYPIRLVPTSQLQAAKGPAGAAEASAASETMRYIMNTNSKEIHDTRHATNACNIGSITMAHKRYLDSLTAVEHAIADEGYNGCHYCMANYDTSSQDE